MKLLIRWLILSKCILGSNLVHPADLKIEILGLKNNDGDIHIALYNNAKDFPSSHGIYRQKQVFIRNNKSACTFKELQPGNYAVAVYHDENNNDKFDQNFLGFPLEDFGFSNKAKVFLGPPEFEDAKFLIEDTNRTITIFLSP